jgi:hypothetical protein
MKTNKILILIVVLFISIVANAQDIEELYTFVINDHYNDMLNENIISEQDTVYFVCGFSDCNEKCFGADVNVKNDKIRIALPKVNSGLDVLSLPELRKQYVVISIGFFAISYHSDGRDMDIIFSGSKEYIFKYSKIKHKYVFKSKKQSGI